MKRVLLALVLAVFAAFIWFLLPAESRTQQVAAGSSPLAVPAVDPAAPQATNPVENAPVVPGANVDPTIAAEYGAWALQKPPQPDLAKIEAFEDWVDRWKKADPAGREALRGEGAKLAHQRRPEFKALIISDPKSAVERAVPRLVRQGLPAEILNELETPVSAVGQYNAYFGIPAPGLPLPEKPLALRYFEANGTSYRAHVPDELANVQSIPRVPLQGPALDGDLAVAPNAVIQLDPGVIIPPGTPVQNVCPVSGKTTVAVSDGEAVTPDKPTVDIGGTLVTLCNGSHVHVLEDDFRTYIQASGTGGSGYFIENFPGNSAKAIGNLRCLYIRVTYPDQMSAPNTEETAYADMANNARFYQETSYGKMIQTCVFTPLVTLPHTQKWYLDKDGEVDGLGLVHSDSRAEAKKLGYDSAEFDDIIVRVNGGPRLSGTSWGGGNSVWITWNGMDVLNHECGHSLGLNHANYWNTTDGTAYGTGANQEYGNGFDVMGGGGGFSAQYNTVSKRMLGWLQPNYVHSPALNGVYRIYAYDQPQLEEGKRYAITVAKDSIRQYNIEYHNARGGLLSDSALVIYSGMGSNAGHLLDTTPGTSGGKNDGGIAIGRTYSDWESDQHFTVLGKNATTPPSLDIAYNRGPFPGNLPPSFTSLSASATSISAGGSVTFTATATDPNSDTLAYFWEFSDGTWGGSNSAVFTRTFSAVDQVTAMCTVSDMKGGIARRSVVINIGSHGKKTISGTVTDGVNPLAGVYISGGGESCYSNADGTYSLSGVATGSQTLSASLAGYTFTPTFTNPINVTADVTGANWTPAGGAFVTLTKTADATEGGSNGNFRLTRTGDTSADLVVLVSPAGGTATKTTDYTFTPDYVTSGSYRSFTIPAGSATLDIAVAAVNDTAAEGPETITLQLASSAGYWSGTSNAVVMTVVDNDTTLPQVSATAPDPYATEGAGGDTGTYTFSRTGSTASSLNVSVAWSGTATNGTDYTTLSTTVTIPAGQSSTTVTVSPIDDSAIEPPETVIATINSNAAYVRDTSATTSTITITDDDTPYVTVSVPDPIASEAGPDSGAFLISRSGSTAAPLTVYYGVYGTASHGTDYHQLPGQVTIPAGAVSAPVVVTPYDDDIGEGDETVTLSVTTFNDSYSLGSPYSGTILIKDNNDPPLVSVRAGTVGVEGGANATVIFHSIGTGTGNVTVNYTVSGTATSGSDYTALSSSVSVPVNGSNDTTVTIPVINDTAAEPTETVVVTITPGTGYRVYNDATAEAIIRDNDSGAERVMVSTYNQSPSESGPTVGTFYFSRTGTTGDLTVNYSISGTATNGTDYVALSGTCIIPDTQPGVNVTVTPIDDALAEGTETVTVTVLPGTGYSPDRPASATMEIADNETSTVTVGFQQAAMATSEQPGPLGEYRDIPVVLSAASANTITVNYISGGGDATGDDVDWAFVDAANGNAVIPYGTLTFSPGTTTQNIRVRIKNDGFMEGGETAILELRSPLNASLTTGRSKESVAIFDDVIPNLVTEERWNTGTVYTNNTWNSVNADVTGFLTSFTPDQNVADNYSRRLIGQIVAPATGTYNFWIASDDASRLYLSTDSTAANKSQIAYLTGYTSFQNWDANASQKSANISLVAGQSYYMEVQHQEGGGGDHVSVAWQGPGFSRTPITFTTPDTAPRTVRFLTNATTRTEADGSEPLLMVTLDRPAGSTPVTVDYTVGGTATAGSDYTLAPGTLTFAAGEQVKLLPLAIIADSIGEAPEAVVVTLTNPNGAQITSPASHTITIVDANAPVVATQQFNATSSMSAGTVVGTMAATVASGRSVVGWTIVAGNVSNAFGINSAGQVSLLTPAALPNPGTRQLVVRVTDSAGATGDGTVNLVCNAPANPVVEQRWSGSTPYTTNTWTGTPIYTGGLTTFTTPQNVADSYSRRLTGYIQPQTSGNYTFWIASDDDSRLYLSTDETAAHKSQIAGVSGYTSYQSWDSQASQKSATIALQAGTVYYMEVNHYEGGGGDHASVAWSGPGISRQAIPSSAIFPTFGTPPVVPSIALTAPADGTDYPYGSTITVQANVVTDSIAITSVDFYDGATLIASDTTAPYSAAITNPSSGAHTLTAKAVYGGGSVTSSTVNVTVQVNSDPSADPDGDGFTTGLEVALGTDPQSASSQPASIYSSLRAWWKLNETSGTIADDTTGRPQDGTVNGGAAWVSGLNGNALSFDGVNDGVVIGTSAALTGTGDFSVGAWVKLNAGAGAGTIIQQREPGSSGFLGEYMVNITASGAIEFFIYNNGYQFDVTSTATVNDGLWHHVVAERAGTDGRVYIDGTLAVQGTGTVASLQSHVVTLGYDYRDSNKYLNGLLDDVRVYERALSAAEIGQLYSNFNPPRPPVFASNPVVKANATEDTAYSASLSGDVTDPNPGDARTFSKVSGPAWLSVAANGALSGTPANADVGANSFVVQATDNGGLSSQATLSISVNNVNDAPTFTANPISGSDATEDSAYSATIAGSATDVDAGDTLSYSKVNGPAWLNVASDGTLSGTPANADVGTNSFTVKVTDAGGLTAQATLNIAVINVNDAPTFTANPFSRSNATEDTAYSGTISGAASDSDSGDTLTYSKVGGPAWLSIAGNGSLSGTPSNADVGTNSFTVQVTDSGGLAAQATLNITVNNVNDAPVFTVSPINKPNATQASAYSNTIAGSAADVDAGDTLTYSKVSGPAWLSVASSGALSGTPTGSDVGNNTWTVRATDSQGATADATLNITVVGLPLPAGWTSNDIGSVGVAGSASENAGTFTVTGSGADIWNTADAFQFASQTLAGDGEIRARVTSQTNTNPWAKAGVMIRETSAAGSTHAIMVITPGNGFSFQYRAATDGASSSVAGPALNAAPNNWVRLTRSGTLLTGYVSPDGATWTQVGTTTISMASTVNAGLAVTSHDNTVASTATFDNVSVTSFPAPWQTVDIGTTGLQGAAEYFSSKYTVKGAGSVSGSADNFRFVYQTLSGDGEIKARISSPGNTGTSARLGVMIRDTLTSGSAYAFMGVNGSSGYYWQRRSSTGGTTSSTTSATGTAPNIWVRVVRTGNTLYGYKSSDGVTWTLVSSRNITMGTTIYIGLVDASGSTTTLNTSIFDNVTVAP